MNGPSLAEIRAVPVETLRDWYRELVELSSLRQVAPLCGVGHSTLHNFLSGASPHPRVKRLLAIYYLVQGSSEDETRPARDALAVLSQGIDGHKRDRVVQQILEVVEQAHRQCQAEPPQWLVQIQALNRASAHPEVD